MIETTNINWRYFDDSGMLQSGASHILEKYSLSADETDLRLEKTVTDPEVFIEPVSSATEWPSPQSYDCIPEVGE